MKTESSPHTSPSQRKNEYYLKLGNGQDWHIIADEDISSWVRKFASVLGISSRRSEHCTKLIFTRIKSGGKVLNTVIESLRTKFGIELPEKGWKAKQFQFIRIWTNDDTSDVICEVIPQRSYKYDISKIWQALYPVYTRALRAGSLPLHSALIERDGKGFLLAGPGTSGKSTCSRRLPHPWRALCDDEAFIVRNDKNQYLAHPIPTWSDYLSDKNLEKTYNIEQSFPLLAIFFLKKGKTDKAVSVERGKAAVLINELTTESLPLAWRDASREEKIQFKKTLFNNSCNLASSVPSYTLYVSPSGPFWKEIEKIFP